MLKKKAFFITFEGIEGSGKSYQSKRLYKYLKKKGFQVYETKVPSFESIKQRAMKLAVIIDRILCENNTDKVNIIAHSMGGLDSRYLISKLGYGNKIASLTMIGTPNRGSPIADFALSITSWSRPLKNILRVIFGEHLSKKKISASLSQLTPSYLKNHFNKKIKDHPNVYYQSWSGESSLMGIKDQNQISPMLLFTFSILSMYGKKNDGLVSCHSAQWGKYRGALPADHFDQIGLPFLSFSNFDHQSFYEKVAYEIQSFGF